MLRQKLLKEEEIYKKQKEIRQERMMIDLPFSSGAKTGRVTRKENQTQCKTCNNFKQGAARKDKNCESIRIPPSVVFIGNG